MVDSVYNFVLVLPRRESGSYTIGGHLGECIDSGSVSVLILRCVGMNGNEKISLHAPRNAEALFEHEEAIIVACKRHAHPARLEQFAADRLRNGKGDILFPRSQLLIERARILPALSFLYNNQNR